MGHKPLAQVAASVSRSAWSNSSQGNSSRQQQSPFLPPFQLTQPLLSLFQHEEW
jgi:hypothetical protein